MSTLYHLLSGTKISEQIVITQNSVCIALIDEADGSSRLLEADWARFRSTYPIRPYFLIGVSAGPTAGVATQAQIDAWKLAQTTNPLVVQGGSLYIPSNMRNDIINNGTITRAFMDPKQLQGTLPGLPGAVTVPSRAPFPEYNLLTDSTVLPYGMPRDYGFVTSRTDLFALCGLSRLVAGDIIFLFVDSSGSMVVANVRATLDLLQERCNAAGIEIRAVSNGSENYILPFIAFTGTAGVPGAAPGTVPPVP